MPSFSFISASSRCGKTTLIEKIVPILKGKGLRISVVKHASRGFELDREGKDSRRFWNAGADTVVLVGPDSMALIRRTEQVPLSAVIEEQLQNSDIVIIEGFKKEAENRIEVYRAGVCAEHPLCMDDPRITALVSDRKFPVTIPQFDINDAAGIAAFIHDSLATPRSHAKL